LRKSLLFLAVVTLLASLPSGCTPNSTAPLQNGSYSVTFDDFDTTGWKAYLVINVQNSTIIDVEYDYIGSSDNGGLLKSEDSSYAEAMFSVAGTKPQLYIQQLEENLLTHQDPNKIETVSGATTSTKDFKKFARLALEAARKGDFSPIIVPQNE